MTESAAPVDEEVMSVNVHPVIMVAVVPEIERRGCVSEVIVVN